MGGLTIVRAQQSPVGLVADRRLYVSADGRLAEEGSVQAAILIAAGPGDQIAASRAKELNLSVVDGKVVQDVPEPAPEPAPEPVKEPDEPVPDNPKGKGKK